MLNVGRSFWSFWSIFPFGYVVPRKIWQPWPKSSVTRDEIYEAWFRSKICRTNFYPRVLTK
jgi:hypothetical protein